MQSCPNCGYENRSGVVFCENCGTSLLGKAKSSIETRALTQRETGKLSPEALFEAHAKEKQGETDAVGSDHFPPNSKLRLDVGDGSDPIILEVDKNIAFGRRDAATGAIPDVDLTPFAGYRMGVSRHHAEIRLSEDKEHLELWDLGSSNGTFLNGDRILAHRSYRLRDGSQIRFGQLALQVKFIKP